MAVAQLLLTYAPPLQAAFGTAPLGLAEWAICAAAGALLLAAVEIEKAVRRR